MGERRRSSRTTRSNLRDGHMIIVIIIYVEPRSCARCDVFFFDTLNIRIRSRRGFDCFDPYTMLQLWLLSTTVWVMSRGSRNLFLIY